MAWEMLLLENLSLGKKLGHISHSAYHPGRVSEFQKRVWLRKTPRLPARYPGHQRADKPD